jgi:Lon protease-like protein
VPSSTKTLHLYEARFLALLDEVIAAGNNLLAHIVVQPVQGDNPGVASFVANYGCLAHIESVRRLDIGALVTIRGIGRLKMVSLTQVLLTALPRHFFTEECLLVWLVLEDKCSSNASNTKYGRAFSCSTKVVL